MDRNLYENDYKNNPQNTNTQKIFTQVIRQAPVTQYIRTQNYTDHFGTRNLTPTRRIQQQNTDETYKPNYTMQGLHQNRTQYIRPSTSQNKSPIRTKQYENTPDNYNVKDGIYKYLMTDNKNVTQRVVPQQRRPVEFTGNNYVANTPVKPPGDADIGKEIGDYVLIKLIGKGNFGKVYLGKRKSDQVEFAVKVIPKKSLSTPKRVSLFKTEVAIMQQFDHPNIMRMEDFLESSNNYYLVMLLCNNSDMMAYMKKRGIEYFKELEGIHYLKQIAIAFRELHKQQIMHRDFK